MNTKYQVLKILYDENSVISGQKIADKLYLSRNSVWKAVESLRSDGHTIESLGNKGYRLKNLNPSLNEEALRLYLPSPMDHGKIDIYESSISTNTLCKDNMEAGNDFSLVATRSQSEGKARNGKIFHSPKGGLYFSFGYVGKDRAVNNSLLTMAIGLATVMAFRNLYGIDLSIKWVNDLVYKDRKVAGILTEASLSLEDLSFEYIICGIGLNILKEEDSYPEGLDKIAGPIFEELPDKYSSNEVIGQIVKNFFEIKDSDDLVDNYKNHCLTLGKEVSLIQNGKKYTGLAKDINNDGSILLEKQGELISLRGGY